MKSTIILILLMVALVNGCTYFQPAEDVPYEEEGLVFVPIEMVPRDEPIQEYYTFECKTQTVECEYNDYEGCCKKEFTESEMEQNRWTWNEKLALRQCAEKLMNKFADGTFHCEVTYGLEKNTNAFTKARNSLVKENIYHIFTCWCGEYI